MSNSEIPKLCSVDVVGTVGIVEHLGILGISGIPNSRKWFPNIVECLQDLEFGLLCIPKICPQTVFSLSLSQASLSGGCMFLVLRFFVF